MYNLTKLNCLRHTFSKKYYIWKTWVPAFQNLYTPSSIGIEGFKFRKAKSQAKFLDSKESFVKKMKEIMENNKKECYIYGDDLKNMIYLCENTPEDIEFLMKMAVRYNSLGYNNRTTTFNFGPEVMRVYYNFNLPNKAKEALNDEGMKNFFHQVSSYTIAMTLFYNAGHYRDVIEAMHKMISERISIKHFPRANFLLTVASFYQLNTPDSLQECLSMIKEAEGTIKNFDPGVISFAAALALRQDNPVIALELTSKCRVIISMLLDVKIQALMRLGRIEETLPILRGVTETLPRRVSRDEEPLFFLTRTIEELEKKFKDLGKNEKLLEFAQIQKKMKGFLKKKSLEDLLSRPIDLECKEQQPYSKVSEREKNRALLTAAFHQRKKGAIR